jgi:nucleoside-diphosphate-sugar epimerase
MIFVTGGTGLVGSHILLKLSEDGKPFKALKRSSSSLNICRNIFLKYNSPPFFVEDKFDPLDMSQYFNEYFYA